MKQNEFLVETKLVIIECCNCGMTFSMPKEFDDNRRNDHEWFYCPAGHGQHYTSRSKEEILREKVVSLERVVDCKKDKLRTLEYQKRHWKGEATKLKKRIEA